MNRKGKYLIILQRKDVPDSKSSTIFTVQKQLYLTVIVVFRLSTYFGPIGDIPFFRPLVVPRLRC